MNRSLKQKFACLVFTACLACASATSFAFVKDNKTVSLGAVEFPPYIYHDEETSECIGQVVDVTRTILGNKGFTLNTVCAPAIRIYKMLQSGDLDLTVNIKSTKLLQGYVEFVEPKYGELELIFVSHDNRGFEKMISAIRGFDYHGERASLAQQGYDFQDTPGSIDAIKMFMRERTRHLITYKTPFEFYLKQNNLSLPAGSKIEVLKSMPTYYALSKQSANYNTIKAILSEHGRKNRIKRFDRALDAF